jgi:hypothetical protein
MKPPVDKDDSLLQKLIESARRHGDSKSIFGLLLLLEREIGSDARRSSVPLEPSDRKNVFNWQEPPIFRRHIE